MRSDAGLLNADDIPVDPMSYKRGGKAYEGLNHTDPLAMWSFQGWAFINWETVKQDHLSKGSLMPSQKTDLS